MESKRLSYGEARFLDVIWASEPVPSGRLVELCREKLGWKKSTTYTVLKKLCERGIFQNIDGIVTPLVSREDFAAVQSERFVEETFAGSLPAFLAAFASRKPLSSGEVDEIQRMIDAYREGK